MRKTRITTCLIFLFVSTLTSYSQSQPSALLWRISGNGLQHPSYLYGTMHLMDRRLFYFSDSLYKALENSEGYAMELDPQEMLDSLLSKMSDDNSPLLKEVMKEKEFKKIEKKLEKKLGMPAGKITRKKLAEARRRSIYNRRKPDDMKTPVDLYLYDVARRLGKTVGGIEDAADQMNILDELGNDINPDKLAEELDDEESMISYIEKMINVYTKEDIGAINQMVMDGRSDFLDMIKRNIKMARRMDSLSHIRNSFFAVGAAHLPGDSGVISLLRKRGFTVEPVISANKIAPEKYTLPKAKISWHLVVDTDSAYTVEMPGKPSDLNMFGNELKFKAYIDMAALNSAYMSCYVFIPEGDSASVVERIQNSYAGKNFDKISEKDILQNGMPGKEIISFKENYYYRMQMFTTRNKMYLLFTMSTEKEQLFGSTPSHFFQSFKANLATEPRPENWEKYTDSQKAFSSIFPGKVSKSVITGPGDESHREIVSYYSLDLKNGAYYAVIVGETEKGYYIYDDSAVIKAPAQNYLARGYTIGDERYFEMNGSPAYSFTAYGEQQGTKIACKAIVLSRGNRSYTVVAVTEKGKEDFPYVSKFLRSFSLIPCLPGADWGFQQPANRNFSVWGPSALDTMARGEEEANPSKETQYVSFDKNAVENYYISTAPVSKYYHTQNDTTFLNEFIQRYYNDTASYVAKNNPGNFDSLVNRKMVVNGNTNGIEILIKKPSNRLYKRLRLLRNGDSTYALFFLAPYDRLYSDNANRFFEAFTFTRENNPTSIFNSKSELLINDLASPDSSTADEALSAFIDEKFEAKELPLLYRAFLHKYDADSSDYYYSVSNRIASKIEEADTTATIDFVKNNYASRAANDQKKIIMLRMLASLKKAEAMLVLKELLLTKPYPQTYPGTLIAGLDDSIQLAAKLFPKAEELFADSVLGPGLLSLAIEIADSGLIDKKIFSRNKEAILAIAKRCLVALRNPDEGYFPWEADMIRALGHVGDKEAVMMLNELAAVKDLETKKDVLLALLRLHQPLKLPEAKKLAMSNYYRVDWYQLLQQEGKEKLFPAEYLNQKKFAECYITRIASEDDVEPENISCMFIAEKTASFRGVPSRFYVYKVVVVYDGEKSEYPAVCGPFNMDRTRPAITDGDNWTNIFYDEKVPTPAKANLIFDLFCKDLPEKK